jgi:hypothetical protein
VSYIQNTWVAYAFDRAVATERVTAGLSRVEAHYGPLYAEPLVADARIDGVVGIALWHPADDRLRWPLWSERGPVAVASTNAITGWERVVGDAEPPVAAVELGEALASDPDRLALLNPPFVIACTTRRPIADHRQRLDRNGQAVRGPHGRRLRLVEPARRAAPVRRRCAGGRSPGLGDPCRDRLVSRRDHADPGGEQGGARNGDRGERDGGRL